MININTKIKLGCTFKIEKFISDGSVTYDGPEFHNTILNSGLSALIDNTFQDLMTYVNLGSSNVPVDVIQTGLLDRKFSSSVEFNGYATSKFGGVYDPPYLYCKRTLQFNIGTCTGTFREIGMSKNSNSLYLNRQLIKDAQGNPMDLVVTASEGIRITVEARMRLDPAIQMFSQIYKLDVKGLLQDLLFFNQVESQHL